MSKIIAADIGGTKIHLGLVHQGKIIKEIKLPTDAQASGVDILDRVIAGIEQLMDTEVVGIGVGMAGLMDEEKGIVYDVTNILSWKELPLKKSLEDHFKKPVYLTNDANAFVLGERLYGRAKSFRNVAGITLGTGLGVGLIINHSLYSGALSGAGEFGSIKYLDNTFETYCSGKFFSLKYGIPGDRLYVLAQEGDPNALAILEQFGHHVGELVKVILYTLSPEAIVIGGSVSNCYRFFRAAMERSLETFTFKRVLDQLTIECTENENAALLGAAALFEIRHQPAAN